MTGGSFISIIVPQQGVGISKIAIMCISAPPITEIDRSFGNPLGGIRTIISPVKPGSWSVQIGGYEGNVLKRWSVYNIKIGGTPPRGGGIPAHYM